MKRYIFTLITLLLSYSIYGQISTREEPVSFRTNAPALEKSAKTEKSFASLDTLVCDGQVSDNKTFVKQ